MDESIVSVVNGENPIINVEISSYKFIINVDFLQSIESEISVHNSKTNSHLDIREELGLKAFSNDVNNSLLLKANASTTYSKNEIDVFLADKIDVLDETITKKGNIFNGINQLVQLNSSGQLPPLDGSLLINIISNSPSASTANMPIMSNNTSDYNNDIDFSSGFCYDLTTDKKITTASMIKQLDATFSEGTNQGGLDTGSKANSTWYYCFAVSKADDTADFLFSTSATSPNMPSDFVNKRRIGCIKTDSSGNIVQFVQRGDCFYWKNPISDISVTNLGTTPIAYNLSIPPIDPINILFTYFCNSSGVVWYIYFYSPFQNTQTANVNGQAYNSQAAAINGQQGGQVEMLTNNGTIYAVSSVANATLRVSTMGYTDKRGAN